jgi:DNA uptake protein ComE-like DNA-binding protein
MENLVSMSSSPEKTAKAATQKMECRHTLSGKKGHIVPEMVRRALGVTNNLNATSFEDMSSSLSSCQSNLDNIRPPTIMDDLDLDNSILSIASISSEFADGDAKMGSSAESANAESRCINLNEVSVAEMTEINDILPPSSLDEVSGVLTSKTLVADAPGKQTLICIKNMDNLSGGLHFFKPAPRIDH